MPLENPFYTAEMQGDFELVGLGRFELEEGGVIEDLRLAVATYGTRRTSPKSTTGKALDQEMIERMRSLGYIR